MAIVASSPYASSPRSSFCFAVKTTSQKFNSDHVVPFHPSLAPYYYRKKNFSDSLSLIVLPFKNICFR